MINLAKKTAWEEEDIEEDFYSTGTTEVALEDDEISAEEAGFMRGFLEEEEDED